MIRNIMKRLYFLFFSIYKYIKYPTCSINSHFIVPGVNLGTKVIINKGCKIQKDTTIGSYTFINENVQIDYKTRIGSYCSISHGVKISLGNHPAHFFSTSEVFYNETRNIIKQNKYDEFINTAYTNIGSDVLLGANSIILSGISIGHGAIIGAGSIVTKNVPPYAIVAGNPAKIIKYRFDDVEIEFLLNTKWWEIEIEKLSTLNIDISNEKHFSSFIEEIIKMRKK
jgi:virginiamycin A acetyltransferase